MIVETPQKIIVGGPLRNGEALMLVEYCDRLSTAGQRRLLIDLTAVTDCDRAGLNGLLLLTSGIADLALEIDGLRWGHFMMLLSTTPVENVTNLCDSVRRLLRIASTSKPGRAG